MPNPVFDLITDLNSRLQSIAGVTNVLTVYSDKDLLSVIQGVTGLSIGIVYEGIRGKSTEGARQSGLAGELTVSLLIVHPTVIGNFPVPKDYGLQVLDNIRNVVRHTTSTTGHFWKFVGEAPAMEKDGNVVWLQRWSTTILMTQGIA